MKQANELALAFSSELNAIKQSTISPNSDENKLHVQTTGASLAELYEGLRNASQNAEENLLLIKAITRFIDYYFISNNKSAINRSGESLIVELTLAGYLANDSIALSEVDHITDLIKQGVTLKNRLKDRYSKHQIKGWVIEPLAAGIESMLRDHRGKQALADLAYNYFLRTIDIDQITEGQTPDTYEATLYIAVQKALLKNDASTIRLNLMDKYNVSSAQYANYARFNQQIDDVLSSSLLDRLTKIVDRSGAPFRIINVADNSDNLLSQHIREEKTFLGPYDAAIRQAYLSVNKSVNRGIIRSVIFLIITKFIIGVAMEVPYDIIVHSKIMWLPLSVNLLIPPIYMIMLRLTLVMPDVRNTKSLTHEASRILFSPLPKRPFINNRIHHFGKIYNFIYALVVISVFFGVGWLLVKLAQFEWIHLIIFFIFISTASFLGFRLSRSIREIEVGDESQTSTTVLRDFIYMPFVVVGRRISETYSKINIVSRLLDMFVELPLKTILGFVRRWGSFMGAKRDEL